MTIKVIENNIQRKIEFHKKEDKFEQTLEKAFLFYKPDVDVLGVSDDGAGNYGLYMTSMPSNSPIDLSSVSLDNDVNNLLSFKVGPSHIRAKVYSAGNKYNVDVGFPVIATGEYIGEDVYTAYYIKDSSVFKDGDSLYLIESSTKEVVEADFFYYYKNGGFGKTFYANGTISKESEYIIGDSNLPS